MGQLGDLDLVNIETIPFKANPYQKKPGKSKSPVRNKPAGSRPFAQLDKLVHPEADETNDETVESLSIPNDFNPDYVPETLSVDADSKDAETT